MMSSVAVAHAHPPAFPSRLTFTGSPLSRHNLYRKDEHHLQSLLLSDKSKFLPFYRLSPLTIPASNHVPSPITSSHYHPQETQPRTILAWFTRAQLTSVGIHLPTTTSSTSSSSPTSTSATPDIHIDDLVLLGLDSNDIPYYVFSITSSSPQHLTTALTSLSSVISISMDTSSSSSSSSSSSPLAWNDVRSLLATVTHDDASLLAHARSLLEWHTVTRYCGRCGHTTHATEGGVKRQCGEKQKRADTNTASTSTSTSSSAPAPIINPATGSISKTAASFNSTTLSDSGCGATLYPRTDSVVITLVISADGERVLLGRKKEFPAGVYTCLAGFLEPGESVDEGVRREVAEESGVKVASVSFFGAQPWPFLGGQLMLGCYGTATPDAAINLGKSDGELEDAQWFTLPEIQSMIAASLELGWFAKTNTATQPTRRIPPPFAIAHQLICHWAQHAQPRPAL